MSSYVLLLGEMNTGTWYILEDIDQYIWMHYYVYRHVGILGIQCIIV